jgi:hypothetical protein
MARLFLRHAESTFEALHPDSRDHRFPHHPDWLHEIKHDGYRLIVQRDGPRVRLLRASRGLSQDLMNNCGEPSCSSQPHVHLVFRMRVASV